MISFTPKTISASTVVTCAWEGHFVWSLLWSFVYEIQGDLAHGISLKISTENVYADVTKGVFAYFHSDASVRESENEF